LIAICLARSFTRAESWPMIASLSLILLCQLIGDVIMRGLGLPMQGPVIGLMLPVLRHGLRACSQASP
jgi:putative effector of murein hydrolase LrgA (UPF0299 family)